MQSKSKHLPRLLPVIVVLAFITAREASAHAILFEATPARNSVISAHSLAVKLRFNVRVDARRSRLALICPGGSLRTLQIKPEQPADIVAADISDLTAGSYDLQWQVLASDGHITRGAIPFTVK